MTRQRNDNHGTQFGEWIRQPKELASKLGFTATDLDYIWRNYKTGTFMFIEEKRCMDTMTSSQKGQFRRIHNKYQDDPLYYGFHLIQFERTSPDDGDTFWNGEKITPEQLIQILKMTSKPSSCFFKPPNDQLDQILGRSQ